MDRPTFEWSTDTERAAWLAPAMGELTDPRVLSVIPSGFESYARLPHPVLSPEGRTVRWSEVAAWSGIELHDRASFPEIALPRDLPEEPMPWNGEGPAEGTLPRGDAAVLAEILRESTTDPQDCWFCLWDGHGWDDIAAYHITDDGSVLPGARPPDPVPAWVRSGPRVRLPERDHLLYTGPVEAVSAFVPEHGQTANLWWPADRSWCVATEIDLGETYLAGSRFLVERVLADRRLEAFPTDPQDEIPLRTLPEWLVAEVDNAVIELLGRGEARITTPCGSVHARLEPAGESGRGRFFVSCGDASGSPASGEQTLDISDAEELRARLRAGLSAGLVELVR
ncbi:hypothetical protein [Actinopolyspora saharensis]|uniref:hypothetical protein n=1 Tax=Actinopolyspora saharensis TaxID=995062 RepID=UPI003F676544